MRRRVHRTDETQKPIVNGLRDCGFQVKIIGRPCDLLVRHRATGKLTLLEVDGITKHRKRDMAQLEFIQDWEVPLVSNLDEALMALGTRIL